MPIKNNQWITSRLQIAIGLLALVLGVILYLYDRPSSQIYFVPASFSLYHGKTALFGNIGYHLPTFLHTFAFCLLTAGLLAREIRHAFLICLFWLVIDGALEIAQQPSIARIVIDYIPDWFNNIPVLENTASYFYQGRYDPTDLAAIVIGSVSAYLVIICQRYFLSDN